MKVGTRREVGFTLDLQASSVRCQDSGSSGGCNEIAGKVQDPWSESNKTGRGVVDLR